MLILLKSLTLFNCEFHTLDPNDPVRYILTVYLWKPYVTLKLNGTVIEEVVDGPEYEVSYFCVPYIVRFSKTLRSHNLLLNDYAFFEFWILVNVERWRQYAHLSLLNRDIYTLNILFEQCGSSKCELRWIMFLYGRYIWKCYKISRIIFLHKVYCVFQMFRCVY